MRLLPILKTEDFSYHLPEERIAKYPLKERATSKLLVYRNESITSDVFSNIPSYLDDNTMLIMNDSKVIPARILFQKPTGGIIEIFCLEPYELSIEHAMQAQKSIVWKCFIGGLSKWKTANDLSWTFFINDKETLLFAKFLGSEDDYFKVAFYTDAEATFSTILEHLGKMPIPPYLKRNADDEDVIQYQTVYATTEGSIAAPTAGLHFTKEILQKLHTNGVSVNTITLHVGAGTFKPITASLANDHVMHAEYVIIKKTLIESLLAFANKSIACVGTTSLRSIESIYWWALLSYKQDKLLLNDFVLPQWTPYNTEELIDKQILLQWVIAKMEQLNILQVAFKTQIIIVPSYPFQFVNTLITNFHQPNSTLLLLVAAFTNNHWKKIYEYAMQHEFRFLSFGDSNIYYR